MAGLISQCIAAGFSPALLVPLMPVAGKPGAGLTEKSRGKVPSIPVADGYWQAADDWVLGMAEWHPRADAAGCNVGLRLGVDAGTGAKLALDGDFDPAGAHLVAPFFDAVALDLCALLQMRETIEPRRAALFTLPPKAAAGRKAVWSLTLADGTPAGKVELLALGQQIAIAGKHHSGNLNRWPGPVPIAAAIPEVATHSRLVEAIGKGLAALEALGVKVKRGNRVEEYSDDAPRTAEELAAPSPAALIELLGSLPHGAETDHAQYVRVMQAVTGALKGLVALGRCTEAEEADVIEAACAWAARWEDPKGVGTTFEAEEEKWHRDWATRDVHFAGWESLTKRARSSGAPGAAVAEAQGDFADLGEALPADAPRGADGKVEAPRPWESRLLRDGVGVPLKGLANVLTVLQHHPAFALRLAFNEFTLDVEWAGHAPWHRASDSLPRPVTEVDATRLREWLERNDFPAPADGDAYRALIATAHDAAFHPVRSYLTPLRWDGVPRIDTWLIDHLGVSDTPLHRAFGSRWLIAGVARIMRPGCKVDTVLILEGDQGRMKSTALNVLAGAWFTDQMPPLDSKDAMLQLRGHWVIEFGELGSLGKAEANRAKNFLSSTTDTYRAPYGRRVEKHLRQCVFGATVNPGSGSYYRDETGARRFWPVLCGETWEPGRKVDIDALRAVRDQLWAEAQHRFERGEKWWLHEPEFERAQEGVTAEREDDDPWAEPVLRYAASVDRDFVTTSDALLLAIGLPVGQHTEPQQRRVAAVLRRAGWTKGNRRIDGRQAKVFIAPAGVAGLLAVDKRAIGVSANPTAASLEALIA